MLIFHLICIIHLILIRTLAHLLLELVKLFSFALLTLVIIIISPRRPMAGGTTNPIQLPNAPQALSDPCLDTVCPLFLADGTQVFNTILI